jgi:phosphate starvation-inducible PhoH-like protein
LTLKHKILHEKIIEIGAINPVDLFGSNNAHLKQLQAHFSRLKIIHRGNFLKVLGNEDDTKLFEETIVLIIKHFERYNNITQSNIENILNAKSKVHEDDLEKNTVLVFGNKGLKVTARTPNQRRMVTAMDDNDMLFAVGPAGSGKTYTAVALAVRALKNKEVRKIILTRPAVEAGENLGFLPGDLKDKLDPYLQPLYDALRDMITPEKLEEYMENNIIQIAPLAYMRGRTLDKAFVILDEGQNATESQIKMFLTRMGESAKFVVTGDPTQVDLPYNQKSGLKIASTILNGVKGIAVIELDEQDVVRHRLVKHVIKAFKKNDEKVKELKKAKEKL